MPRHGWKPSEVNAASLAITDRDRARFEAFLYPEPNSGCLLFSGSDNGQGYGMFGLGGRVILAHRFAWAAAGRDIPAGILLLHKCDVPCCVSIDHLYLGTNADNNADMARRGRKGSSAMRGIRVRGGGKFHAYVTVRRRYIHLGTYGDLAAAKDAVRLAREAAFGRAR